ncbi:hypothetical protein FPHOBKDP_00219 [Listeria phage LPJP1]|nr:hypothetical protein FPHOBKDP_00219 [Listeria phage LPJP1]
MPFMDNSERTRVFRSRMDESSQQEFPLKISVSYLFSLARYVVYPSKLITRTNLRNLDTLLSAVDIDRSYLENEVMEKNAFIFLREINRVLLHQQSTIETLFDYIDDELKDREISEDALQECVNNIAMVFDDNFILDDSEILSLTNYVESRLKIMALYRQRDRMEGILELIKMNKSPNEINTEFKDFVTQNALQLRKIETNNRSSMDDIMFSRDNDRSVDSLDSTIRQLRSPSNKLLTGYSKFNEMINGGLEDGRLYLLFGVPKSFKSGVMLNIGMSVCHNNAGFKTKDPNKEPTVVYLSQENTIIETVERLYEYITGTSINESQATTQDVLELIMQYTYDCTGIYLKIMYRPNKSIDTSYLYNIYDELNEEGKECIFMIQDYTRRIRPSEGQNQDIRIQLGNISDEFCTFAKEKGIPVMSAGQLNRNANEIVEDALVKNRSDFINKLGRHHIAESAMLLENADYGIIIGRQDYLPEGEDEINRKSYMSFKLIASRGKNKDKDSNMFSQPFENGFKIAEDINLAEPLAKLRINEQQSQQDMENSADEVITSRTPRYNSTSKSSSIVPGINTGKRRTNLSSTALLQEDDIPF